MRLVDLSQDKIYLFERWNSDFYRLYIEIYPDWI